MSIKNELVDAVLKQIKSLTHTIEKMITGSSKPEKASKKKSTKKKTAAKKKGAAKKTPAKKSSGKKAAGKK